MNPDNLTPEQAAADAIHKAKNAAAAVEMSREVQQMEMLAQTKGLVLEALREVFGEGDKTAKGEMNILVRRIPFICEDIVQIHKSIEKIDGNISKGVWIILGAVVLALMKLILVP